MFDLESIINDAVAGLIVSLAFSTFGWVLSLVRNPPKLEGIERTGAISLRAVVVAGLALRRLLVITFSIILALMLGFPFLLIRDPITLALVSLHGPVVDYNALAAFGLVAMVIAIIGWLLYLSRFLKHVGNRLGFFLKTLVYFAVIWVFGFYIVGNVEETKSVHDMGAAEKLGLTAFVAILFVFTWLPMLAGVLQRWFARRIVA